MTVLASLTTLWQHKACVCTCISGFGTSSALLDLAPQSVSLLVQFAFCVCGPLQSEPSLLSTHHFLLLSLPLLLDLFSQFVQLILSGQQRLQRNTQHPHHTQWAKPLMSKTCLIPEMQLYYLHEFVALEYGCSVKYQLAVFNIIFESCHIDLTERHELLKQRGGKCYRQLFRVNWNITEISCNTYSPADLQATWQFQPFWHNFWRTQYLEKRHNKVVNKLLIKTQLSHRGTNKRLLKNKLCLEPRYI